MNNHTVQNTKKPQYLIMLVIVAGVLSLFLLLKLLSGMGGEKLNVRGKSVTDTDLVITLSEITENALFFPAVINGTELEIIALKAPDGTVRIAYNTCQVCYLSGKGYYTQKGEHLVCENCGNRFSLSEVGVAHSGCNPIPLTANDMTVSNTEIIIPMETLSNATKLFSAWKR